MLFFVFSLVQCAFWLVLYIHFVYFVASFLALFNIVAFVAYIYIYFIFLLLDFVQLEGYDFMICSCLFSDSYEQEE